MIRQRWLVFAVLAGLVACQKNRGKPGIAEVWTAPPPGADGAIEIKAVAERWMWTISQGDRSAAGEMLLPVGRIARLKLGTKDDAHRMSIPPLGIDFEAKPGETRELWVRVLAPGTYPGQCSNDCTAPNF